MVELKQLAIAVNTFVVMEQSSPIQGVRPTIPTELISSLPVSQRCPLLHSETCLHALMPILNDY